MDLCNRFVADVFDDETIMANEFIKEKELDMDAIMQHPKLRLQLLYTIVWNGVFNTFPTKYDFRDYLAQTSHLQQHGFATIMQSFMILKLVPYDVNLLQTKCQQLLQHMEDKSFVKNKILEKWYYRFYPHFPDPELAEVKKQSLFHTYLANIKKVSKMDPSDVPDVFILPSGNMDYHPNFTLKYGTQNEQMQYMIHKDNHFCRRLAQNGLILIDSTNPPLEGDKLVKTLQNIVDTDLVLDYQKMNNVMRFLPKIAKVFVNLTGVQNIESPAPNATFNTTHLIDVAQSIPYPEDFKKGYYKALLHQSRDVVVYTFMNGYFKKHANPSYTSFDNRPHKDNVIVLIDNRPNIMSVLSMMLALENIEKDKWNVIFYTSTKARTYYEAVFKESVDVRVLEDLNTERFNIDLYNKIMMSPSLWNDLKGWDKVLIIQDDGLLLRPGVEAFLQWDYIGAPWIDVPDNDYLKKHVNSEMVGNGGLSLRSVKAMMDISTKYEKEKNQLFYHNLVRIPEDVYYVKAMMKEGIYRLPEKAVGSAFSSEQVVNLESIGVHKMWAYNDPSLVAGYFEKCL